MKNGKWLAAIAIVAGFAINLIVLGVAWGTLTTRVSTVEDQARKMEEIPVDLARMEEKIDALDEKVIDLRDILRRR